VSKRKRSATSTTENRIKHRLGLEFGDKRLSSWTSWGDGLWGYVVPYPPRHAHGTLLSFVLYNTTIVGDQLVPYGRCNHHNCADEECDAEENRAAN
jgi:hypothetical protein